MHLSKEGILTEMKIKTDGAATTTYSNQKRIQGENLLCFIEQGLGPICVLIRAQSALLLVLIQHSSTVAHVSI